MTDIVERLKAPEWRGPRQHLRGWDELDALHADAASEIERLRAALENLVIAIGMGWDLDGVLDAARAVLGENRT